MLNQIEDNKLHVSEHGGRFKLPEERVVPSLHQELDTGIRFNEPLQKVIVLSAAENLPARIKSLMLPNMQVLWVKTLSELIKLCTVSCVSLVLIDLENKTASDVLNICYEARKNSQNVVSFAFFCHDSDNISLSEKIYAGCSVQLDENDSDQTLKEKLSIALFQCRTEEINILILKDKKKEYSDIANMASSCGIMAGTTENLDGLLEELADYKPHMIFLDTRKTAQEICEIAQSIREKALDIPIIARVPDGIAEPKAIFLSSGIDEILVSPISVEELMSCIRMQLRYSVLRRKYARNKTLGRFFDMNNFEKELADLVDATLQIDSTTAVCNFQISNLNDIKETHGILTTTLWIENFKELVKARFRLKDLISIRKEDEILFALPDVDKDLATRIMIDLELELSKFKLSQNTNSLSVKIDFKVSDTLSTDFDSNLMIKAIIAD